MRFIPPILQQPERYDGERGIVRKWYLGSITMLLGAVSYGVSGPFAKLAYKDGLSVGELVTSMFLISTLIFWLLFSFSSRKFDGLSLKELVRLFFLGSIGLGATVSFYYISINQLPVSVAIVLLFQFAWIVILIDIIRSRKWPSMYMIISLCLVVSGTYLSAQIHWGFWRDGTVWGYLFGFIAAICYSLFLNYNAEVALKVSPITRSAIMSTSGLLVVLFVYPPSYLWDERFFELGFWPVISGLLNQVFPTLLMAIGIPFIGGALPGILGAVELPVSVISANFILNEPISLLKWIGIALILLGILIAGVAKKHYENKYHMVRKE